MLGGKTMILLANLRNEAGCGSPGARVGLESIPQVDPAFGNLTKIQ